MTTPAELLDAARDLPTRADPKTAGLWPRAAALLAWQALEQALDEYWRSRQPPLDQLATHPQLICLREYLHDAGLAGSGQAGGQLVGMVMAGLAQRVPG